MTGFEEAFRAIQTRDDAAGFADNQAARSQVPSCETGLPECIEPSGGDVGEVERRGARPADAGRILNNLGKHGQVGRQVIVDLPTREARADKCAFQLLLSADANSPAVQLRPVATGCREEFLPNRIVDDSVFHAAVDLHADRYGKHREAMQVIRRAIEGVNDPEMVGLALRTGFLGQDGVIGVVLEDAVDYCLLGRAIGVANVVVMPFLLDLELLEAGHFSNERRASATRRHYGHIKQCVHETIPSFVKNMATIGRGGRIPDFGPAKPDMSIRIVLVGTTHPGNIGAVARGMKNMGLKDLALVEPRYFPHEEATARASGAHDLLENALVFKTLEEAIADCVYVAGASARSRTINWPCLGCRDAAARLLEESTGGRVAAVFGPEKTGLSNADLDHCDTLLTIPTDPDFSSLNLAMAVQVLSYEIRAAQAGKQAEYEADAPLATSEELEHFYDHLEQVLTDVRFLDPDNPRHLMRRLRRLFIRARPDKNELNILRGVLTAVDRSRGGESGDGS